MSALFPVILNRKLHEESLKKINFKTVSLEKLGKQQGKYVIFNMQYELTKS